MADKSHRVYDSGVVRAPMSICLIPATLARSKEKLSQNFIQVYMRL